jgi:hypothetical protein
VKRIGILLLNSTLWAGLAAFAGHHIGTQGGYQRGVRDIAALVITLREASEPPAPWQSGSI